MAVHVSITTNLQASYQHEDDGTLWQDTAQTTASTTGDPVGSWDDQTSTNDLQQGTTANKPTHTADGISFDGSSDRISNTAIASTATGGASFSMYGVASITYTQYGIMFMFGNTTSSVEYIAFGCGGSDQYLLSARSTSGTDTDTTVTATDANDHVWSMIGNGTTVKLYEDGSLLLEVNYPTTDPTLDIFGIGAMNRNGWRDECEGVVKACYIYDVAHNDTDRGTIESDLTAAYISTVQTLQPDAVSFTDTVQQPTVSNLTAQSLSPDTVTFSDTVEQPTVSNEAQQTLQPNVVLFTDTVEQPTISNEPNLSLSPDVVVFSETIEQPTISNATAQALQPDVVSFTDTIEQPTIANATAQSLQLDTVSFTETVLNPTITLVGQILQPDVVTFSDTVLNPSISNATAQALQPDALSFNESVQTVTISLGTAQTLSPNVVTFTDTILNPTISNGVVVLVGLDTGVMVIERRHTGVLVIERRHTGVMEVKPAC